MLIPPALMNLVGQFSYFYSYMLFFPACLLLTLCHSVVTSKDGQRSFMPHAVLLLASTVAIAIGIPSRLFLGSHCFEREAPSQITHVLRKSIVPSDVVCCENTVFFDVKSITPSVFGELYLRFGKLQQQEKDRINVLVIFPQDADRLTHAFGGEWKPDGPPFGPRRNGRPVLPGAFMQIVFERYFSSPLTTCTPVQIFRRVPSGVGTSIEKPNGTTLFPRQG